MKKIYIFLAAAAAALTATSCNKFLSEQIPQAALIDEQVKDPAYVDKMVISAYAILTTAEDINSSFSMWNYDVRSDDAYKGGSSTNDGEVFAKLEIEKGVLTTDWNINDMWERLYKVIARANTAMSIVEKCDESAYKLKNQRLAELRFIRAYGHFLLKRLYKNIPFVLRTNYSYEDYGKISNTEFSNDEGWQKIIDDLTFAYKYLPASQVELGRPNKAACAAFLAKAYLYKAYRQDNPQSHEITSINAADLEMVKAYTKDSIYVAAGYSLESDIHNNFRPEERYENGCESIWAIQYSRNDGSTYGNLNWSNGLIPPNIDGVTDGGCDFYKPSQNLINAFRTDADGLPYLDSFNDNDYDKSADNADPRLFLTVGMPGFPYMFNTDYIIEQSPSWGRSGELYKYNITLKQNVDPELIGSYLIKGSFWATSMNRIVFRYADVLLMRAEALAQLGETDEAIKIVNKLRNRAASSTQMISTYPARYGVKFLCKPYTGSYGKDEAMKIIKMERRLELAMEAERFFDLVRWGDAKTVLTKYFDEEKTHCSVYNDAEFTLNKNEYLPVPHKQISASNGHYTQNIGNW